MQSYRITEKTGLNLPSTGNTYYKHLNVISGIALAIEPQRSQQAPTEWISEEANLFTQPLYNLVKKEETGQIPNRKQDDKLKQFFALKSMFCPVFKGQSFKIPELLFLPERQMVVAFPQLK